jgi:PKD repeat protein
VSHTFADRGDFIVKLTVQTDKGLTNSTTKTISATFACGDVSPFVSSDIGSPSQAGCGHKEGDCIVVLGGGMDITGASDQFQLVHKSKTGDVSLSANITEANFEPPVRGRAGVMMRDGTAADAAFAAMEIIPSGGNLKAFFQSRATTGAAVVNKTTPNVSLVRGAAYLKIERAGNDFIGSTSPDGTTYTEFARVTLTAPPASMLAGLMVSARDTTGDGTAAEVTFCNIKYSDEASNLENCTNGIDDDGDQAIDCADSDCSSAPSCQGGGTFHRGDADSNGQLQLTDAIRILGVLFLGQGSISCMDAADADDNGSLQLTDAIRILGVLFLGQGVIPAPGPTSEPCGGDPTADALDCADYPAANCQ